MGFTALECIIMLSKNIKIVMLTNFKHFWQNTKIDLLNHLIVKLNNCIATANVFVNFII